MKSSKLVPALLFAAFAVSFHQHCTAQSSIEFNQAAAAKIIAENNNKYFNAFLNKDSAMFSSLYTPDCWIMAPNTAVFCGPRAANEFFMETTSSGNIQKGKFITIDAYGISGDMIAEVGFYRFFNDQDTETDNGKYIVLWKKMDGVWKRFRDSFSSSKTTHE